MRLGIGPGRSSAVFRYPSAERTVARWCSAWLRISGPRSRPAQHHVEVVALTMSRQTAKVSTSRGAG